MLTRRCQRYDTNDCGIKIDLIYISGKIMRYTAKMAVSCHVRIVERTYFIENIHERFDE